MRRPARDPVRRPGRTALWDGDRRRTSTEKDSDMTRTSTATPRTTRWVGSAASALLLAGTVLAVGSQTAGATEAPFVPQGTPTAAPPPFGIPTVPLPECNGFTEADALALGYETWVGDAAANALGDADAISDWVMGNGARTAATTRSSARRTTTPSPSARASTTSPSVAPVRTRSAGVPVTTGSTVTTCRAALSHRSPGTGTSCSARAGRTSCAAVTSRTPSTVVLVPMSCSATAGPTSCAVVMGSTSSPVGSGVATSGSAVARSTPCATWSSPPPARSA